MKTLIRFAIILALPVVLAACASKSGFEPYVPVMKETKDDQPKTYQLVKVSLELGGDLATPRYPDQATLEKMLADELQSALKQQSLVGARYGLRVAVKWDRKLVDGSPTKASDVFSSAGCTFVSRIQDEKGVLIAADAGDPLNTSNSAYQQKNIFNNLKRIKDSLTRSGDPESEVRELKRCVELLVERLPR